MFVSFCFGFFGLEVVKTVGTFYFGSFCIVGYCLS